MRSILIAFILVLSSIASFANFSFNKNCRKAYEQMMIFDFVNAQKTLYIEKQIHPDNRVPDYISTYILFWKAALNEEEADMDYYEDKVDNLIDEIEDDPQESAYKSFFLSDIYLRGAYIKAMQTSYMSAAYKFNKAYNLVQKNKKKYPNFIPNKKLIGLMNVGIGTVPDKYTWVLDLFNFEGNIKEGLKELKGLLMVASKNDDYHYLMSESLLLYSFTMENFEVSQSSVNELLDIYEWEIIKKELPSNQFMIFSKASFLKHIKRTDAAIECIQNNKTVKGAMHFYYLDYMLGGCLINKMDMSAADYLKKYVNEYHGNSYRRSACQKLAWTYLLQGETSAYQSQISKCLTFGNDNRDSDRQATKEAEREAVPNKLLLSARLLFDGGYYEKAIVALKKCNTTFFSKREQLEYIYRYARVYDEFGQQDLAISYYRKCIGQGENESYYFAANSALHLGYIYEKQGNIIEARKMFEKCLDMDFDEYRDGIEQKAKAALERVGDE